MSCLLFHANSLILTDKPTSAASLLKGEICVTDLFCIEKLKLYLKGPIYSGEIRLKGKKAHIAYLRPILLYSPTWGITIPYGSKLCELSPQRDRLLRII